MPSATLELQWPSAKLSPNARTHWAKLSGAKKAAKLATQWDCKAQGVPENIGASRVLVSYIFLPPDARRRDLDNLAASMKAAQDGIAEWLGVDDSKFVPTYEMGDPVKGGSVIVNLRWADLVNPPDMI